MSKNIWKIVGILFVIYFIIWFWPVLFGRPLFKQHMPRPTPYMPSHTAPAYKVVDPGSRFDGNSNSNETPYNPTQPDPVAPPHSSDEPSEPVACTMEARECPDGSYVGRQGPHCEFAPCPGN